MRHCFLPAEENIYKSDDINQHNQTPQSVEIRYKIEFYVQLCLDCFYEVLLDVTDELFTFLAFLKCLSSHELNRDEIIHEVTENIQSI